MANRAESVGDSKTRWHCQCSCGQSAIVLTGSLTSGKSTSCGCLRRETIASLVVDLTGQTFGRLTVLHRVENDKRDKTRWMCRCECGTEIVRTARLMRKGESLSCGCLQRETNVSAPTRHGAAKVGRITREYIVWQNMLARCENKGATAFESYGGRGITVCERWHDFAMFSADMGLKPSPSHSLDRIDNSGNYEPSNCRWATSHEQARNKRNNKFVTHDGETLTLAEWAERLGTNGTTIGLRLRRGWSDARTVTELVRSQPRPSRSPSLRFNLMVTP